MPMSTPFRTSAALRLVSILLLLPVLPACPGPSGEEFDRQQLERIEDLSESLANDLLAFSVAMRDRDFDAVQDYLAERIDATPFPEDHPPLEPVVKWIQRREWAFATEPRELERDGFLANLRAFTGLFTEIDDARVKVKASDLDTAKGDRGMAKIKFFIVGRDEEERREWLKGTAEIAVVRPDEGPWRIRGFRLETLASKVSLEDLFSEVAVPAGLAAVFPDFGVGKNQGFVSHGGAAADVNGDGLLDLAASGVEQNFLYLNDGEGAFRDVSAESLVKFAPIGSGALFLDYDNDGDADLFFAAVGHQVLLENRFVPDGNVQFWDVSEQAGVALPAVGFSAVSADVNGDGYPDVYVCSYNHYGTVMPNSWIQATNGTPNLLLINQGDGTFRERGAEWGVDDDRWSYAAGFVDIDLDGDQDLYVANDFGVNAFYRNDGDRFTDVAPQLGVPDHGFGMGVSFGDYDNDGDFDLHVTNMSSTAGNRILKLLYPDDHVIRASLDRQAAGNSLYRNNGNGTFDEVTEEVGGFSGGWAFGGGFVDFDNDGWEDIYTPNGFISGKTMKDT
jgi:hypothetical protein